MIKYEMFYREFIIRKVGDFTRYLNPESFKELPVGSILHILDNVNDPTAEIISTTPNNSNTFFNLKPEKKEIYFQTEFTDKPITVNLDKVKLLNIGLSKDLVSFRRNYKGKLKYNNSISEFTTSSQIGNIISYNSMFKARVLGKLALFRKFNAIMTSVINNVESNVNKQHFIHLPLGGINFSRSDFTRALKEQIQTTLKFSNNFQYLFILNLLTYINEETTAGLFDKMSKEALEKTNIIIEHKGKIVIYNLKTLKEMGDSVQVFNSTLNHLNGLNVDVVTKKTVDTKIKTLPTIKSKEMNITKFSGVDKKIKDSEVKKYKKEKAKTTEEVIEATQNITPKQKTRLKTLVEKTSEIDFEGESIKEILEKPDNSIIVRDELDFLEDQIPDKSMLKSSLRNTRTAYMENNYKKDMIAVLTSFSSVGMILTKLKSEDVVDNQNRLIKYTASFEDVNGKRHTIKYSIPMVDKDGNCFLNGAKKSLRMQRVNLPIVKVSESRVSLSSNQNKTLIERSSANAHNFETYFNKLLKKADKDSHSFEYGVNDYNKLTIPYEYSIVGKRFKSLTVNDISWNFDYHNRFGIGVSTEALNAKQTRLISLEDKHGLYIGGNFKEAHFLSNDSILTIINKDGSVQELTTFLNVLINKLDVEMKSLTEWVDFKILDSKIPLIIALSYRFGLTHMLEYLNVPHAFYERNERVKTKHSDIVIRFADMKLVIDGRSKNTSLMFGGLSNYKMDEIYFEEMNERDAYFNLFEQKRLSVNYLKGIDTFFKLFMDPITADVLANMGEPTNMKDLLIRASSLLVTIDHMPASSSANFRFRSYERFNDTIYNTLSRALSTYQNGSMGASKKFSISSFEILQSIFNDPLLENVDVINPVNELKGISGYSHIGEGGRSGEAFVLNDRQYPEDGIGIISEATVDSGKVAIDAMLSMNPNILNTRGMTVTKNIDDIEATELLSATALLIPGATNDDGKRTKQSWFL